MVAGLRPGPLGPWLRLTSAEVASLALDIERYFGGQLLGELKAEILRKTLRVCGITIVLVEPPQESDTSALRRVSTTTTDVEALTALFDPLDLCPSYSSFIPIP